MRIARLDERGVVGIVVAVSIAALVTWQTLRTGVPSLCHDWRFPADTAALSPFLLSLTSGWIDVGIGEAQPYPTFYHLAFLLWVLHFVAAPVIVIGTVVAGSSLIASLSAFTFARRKNTGVIGASAIAIFASCNPWVYTKLVAGHIFMVLAYALLLALVAEIDRPHPRRPLLIVLATLTIVQLQFFLIVAVPLTVWAVRRRLWIVAAAPWFAFAPIAAGIITEYATLRATPFTLTWQQGMSVPPLPGLALMGYVFDYAHAFRPLAPVAAIIVAVALSGLARLRTAHERTVVGIAVVAWIVASGTQGWIAPEYGYAALHFPETGVYRELYDLLALVAIGYVVLLANALAGRVSSVITGLTLAASIVVGSVWIIDAPVHHFTASASYPHPALPTDSQRRVVMLPAFQPITLDGKSSGVDPDAFVRPHQSMPINEALPLYPVDVALAALEYDGTSGPLRALGVWATVDRPYLHSDSAVLDHTSLPFVRKPSMPDRAFPPAPLLGVTTGEPPTVAVGDDTASYGRLFTTTADDMETPTTDTSTTDFRHDWVDARLAFRARPEWGTVFGGLATASQRLLPFDANGMHAVLAQTDGSITDERGRVLVPKRTHLHWWPLLGNEHALRCTATCIVVAFTRVTPPVRDNGPVVPATAVHFRKPVPWLAVVDVPAHPVTETLRYLERYDADWQLVGNADGASHERLVGDLNGWILPGTPRAMTLALVHWPSAVILALEALSFAFVAWALVVVRRGPPNGDAA